MSYSVRIDPYEDGQLVQELLEKDSSGWFLREYFTSERGREEFIRFTVQNKLDELNGRYELGGWLEDQLEGTDFYSLTDCLDYLEDKFEDAMEFIHANEH